MKKFKTILLFVLSITILLSVVLPLFSNAADINSINNRINSTYSALRSKRGGSYDGWCGQYVIDQLNYLGIGFVTNGKGLNGNQWYNNIIGDSITSSGYKQLKFGGGNCLYDIISKYGSEVYYVVVSFPYQYGASYSNPGAGHVVLLHAIINNTVYFSESYSGWGVGEGVAQSLSVSAFMLRYSGAYGTPLGAILFTKNTQPLPSISYSNVSGTYYIKNVAYNCMLDVANADNYNGANVQLCTVNYSNAQKMEITNGAYQKKIRPLCSSSRVINVKTANSVYNGQDVCLWDITNDDSQCWGFEKVGDYYVIRSMDNPSCCLTATGGSGSNVNVQTYSGTNSQKWKLECVSHSWNGGSVTKAATCAAIGVKTYTCTACGTTKTETINKLPHTYVSAVQAPYTVYTCSKCGYSYKETTNPIVDLGDDFFAYIRYVGSGRNIEVSEGRNVQTAEANHPYPCQIWYFIKQTDYAGTYKIVNLADGNCLDALNQGTANGTNIQTCADNGCAPERWYIVKNGDYYRLKSSYCSSVIDITGGSKNGGVNVELYEWLTDGAQNFVIEKINMGQLDVNTILNDEFSYTGFEGITFDVYVNGHMEANDVVDYVKMHPIGSDYLIDDIKTTDGVRFKGIASDSESLIGKVTALTLVSPQFDTLKKVYLDPNFGNSGVNYFFEPDKETITSNGITMTFDPETGIITLNGTANLEHTPVFTKDYWISDRNCEYTAEAEYIGGSVKNGCFVFEANSGKEESLYPRLALDSENFTNTANWKITDELYYTNDFVLFTWAWSRDGKPVTFNNYQVKIKLIKKGVENTAPYSMLCGQTYGTLPDITRDGYELLGWYNAPVSGDKIISSTKAEKNDEVLYAHWKKNGVESGDCGASGNNVIWSFDKATGVLSIIGNGEMKDYTSRSQVPWHSYYSYDINTVEIADGITHIGDYAFADCEKLTAIEIPDSVTSIGNDAFVGCDCLKSIDIPDSVISIGNHAFGGCIELTDIKLSNNLTNIGDYAFEDCLDLTDAYIYSSGAEIGRYSFPSETVIHGITGSTAEAYCKECGNKFVLIDCVHKWDDGTVTTPATCTTTGVKTYKCKECGNTKTETIAITTHTWNSGTVTSSATCTAKGVKTYTCSVCKTTKTEEIAALGHNFSTNFTTDKAATCTAAGSKSKHCTRCSATTEVTSIPATGHKYDNACDTACNVCGATRTVTHAYDSGTVTKAATCATTGVKTYTCTVCGATKTETIAKTTTHMWNSGTVTTAATCTATGVKTYTCTVCGATKTETINKLAHTFTEKVDANYLKSAATETSAAVYFKSCSVCGAVGTETFTYGAPLPPVVETNTVLGISSEKAAAGNEISLTLSIKENPGIAGLSVSLNYDETVLTLKSAVNGTLFTSFTSGKNYIFDSASNMTGDGTLATFTFTVKEDAEAGEYTVTPIVRSCVNDIGEDVPVKTESGSVSVIAYLYGDANEDGMIDMKDVVNLRRYLAEFDYETNTSSVSAGQGADANADGVIDMKDVVLLRKYLAEFDYETNTSPVVLGPQ